MADPQPNTETAALRAALQAANRQTAEQRQRATTAETRAHGETVNRLAAQEIAVETAIAQATSAESLAKQKWAALQAEGNFEAAADAMADMTRAAATLTQLQRDKSTLAQHRQQVENQPATQADPLANFSQEERDWIAANPRYMSDPNFQADANAAAMNAERILKIPRGSPAWFEHIEKAVYPERQTAPAPAGDTGEGGGGNDADIRIDLDGETGGGDGLGQQHHNMDAPAITVTPEAPAMRLDEKPAEPQQRAIGRGGSGVTAVAAPPSRRIAEVSNRLAKNNRIEATGEELQTARALYDSIESNAADRSDETIIRWYHALYNSPTHRQTRRKNWVYAERGEAA